MEGESAQTDTFARDRLPPAKLWPNLDFSKNDHLNYPDRLNCATELLDNMAQGADAERVLFHMKERAWTYGEFLEKANQIANVLVHDLGLEPGNRVLLRGANTPMMAACWFGVVKAGGICVTTMPLLRARELSYVVDRAEVSICLCEDSWKSEIKETRKENSKLSRVVYFGFDAPDSLESKMVEQPKTFANVDTAAEDVVLIGFTSGTTGQAKATMHFHRDVLAICDLFPHQCLDPKPEDVYSGTPPFAFTFGLGGILLFPMRYGSSIALVPKPGPEELLEAIKTFRVTHCFTSPTAYRAMLDFIPKYDVSSLRKCVSAGETLPLPTFEAWKDKTGLKLIDGIGATELLHIFISAAEDEIRPGSTGKPLRGYEAIVVDDGMNPVDIGEVGLLAVRGPTGCRYMDDEERQADYVRDGWNLTGDAYRVDRDGYFWFQCRADDMIISSGYNISGIEVENVLLSHPEVKECGVIGAPDEERGHIVKAFIVLRNPDDAGSEMKKALQDFVKAEMAPYKYPRAIEFMNELPRTETGKLQRFKLRDQ